MNLRSRRTGVYPIPNYCLGLRPLAYWRLFGNIFDYSRAKLDLASSSNTTLNGYGATFNGTTSYITAYTAAIAAALNNQIGSLALSLKVANAGVWTDAALRYAVRFAADSNNAIDIIKHSTSNQLTYEYRAGGTVKAVNVTSISSLNWLRLVMTWNKSGDAFKAYLDGVQQGATQTGLGVWAGAWSAANCMIGAFAATTNVTSGSIKDVAIWDRVLTDAEIARL
jgi:hypothetical protein